MTTTQSSQAVPGTLPWWVLEGWVLGSCYVLLGLLLIVLPAASLMAILTFAGAAWFVSGAVDLLGRRFNLERLDPKQRNFTFARGLLGVSAGVSAGVVVLSQPLLRDANLLSRYVLFLGFIGLAVGVLRMVQGFLREISNPAYLIRGSGLATGIWGAFTILISGFLLVYHGLDLPASIPFVGAIALLGGAGTLAAVGVVHWLYPQRVGKTKKKDTPRPDQGR